ncbi:phosphatase PAP2 family protein [Candidatus Berkelbacteria bacterium]|nr:phosphatase PAP2 family protein [Candidatus Berkelbacteria bacterium]
MWLLELDKTITFWLYKEQLSEQVNYLASYFIYLLPLSLIYLFFHSYKDRLVAIKVLIISIFSWKVLSYLTGLISYNYFEFRDRPFATYGIKELFFERPEKAFPSDHAALLATATLCFFYYKYPRLGWFFLIGGVIVSSFARVVIGFHWFGDVVGGWVIGLIAFGVLTIFDRSINIFLEKFLLFRGNVKKV